MVGRGKNTTGEYAEWIDTMHWDLCVTLTRRSPIGMKGVRELNEKFFDFMGKQYEKPRFIWVAEPFDLSTSYHAHGMVHLGTPISKDYKKDIRCLKDGWRTVANGGKGKDTWTVIEPYIKGMGWARYIAKNMDKDNSDWFIHGL
jgi:hypothetical protein